MIEVKDQFQVNIPEKTYQDSQKTTETLTKQAEKVGKLEAENKSLKEKLEREAKEIKVTLEKGSSVKLHDMFYGVCMPKIGNVESIKINNVNEADKFLTTVLESEISQERDALQKKYETLETKLDEKDRKLVLKDREITRMKEVHTDDSIDDRKAYEREITKIRKTASAKVEKRLLTKDVEYAELNNQVEIERQEANLRETDLLGKLKVFEEANKVLEAKVSEIENSKPSLLGKMGNYLNKMTGYKKAVKELQNFNKRDFRGRVSSNSGFIFHGGW